MTLEGRVTEAELYDNRSVVKQILDLRARLDAAGTEIAALKNRLSGMEIFLDTTSIPVVGVDLKDATGTATYQGGFVYRFGSAVVGNINIKFENIVLGTGTPRVEVEMALINSAVVPIITQIRDSTGKHIGTLVKQPGTDPMAFRMYQAPTSGMDYWMSFSTLLQ